MDQEKQTLILRKTRSAAAIINRSLRFLSSESRELIRLIGLFAAPFLVVALLISYFISYSPPSVEKVIYLHDSPIKNYFVFMIIALALFIAGLCIASLIMIKVIMMRSVPNELSENNGSYPSLKELLDNLKNYGLNFLIVYALYSGAMYLIREAENNNFLADGGISPDILTYIVDLLIWYLPLLILYPPVIFLAAVSLFVSVRDNIGATDALNQILKIVREKPGKMYGTGFLICLIAVLAELIAQFILNYFGSVLVQAGLPASTFLYVIILKQIFSFGVLIFTQVSCIVLFGSLEDELEGHYMKSKIEQV